VTDTRITDLDDSPAINGNYLLMVVSDEAIPDNYKITRNNLLADLIGAVGISFEETAKPVASGAYSFIIPYELIVPADASTSSYYGKTNPTAQAVVSIKDDGTEIATLTVATDGTATWATASGTAKTIAAGSRVSFVFPAQDSTWAGVVITLKGARGI
jgi:hypothetical protein